MSRIWKLPVSVPEKVSTTIDANTIVVKGPLWELTYTFSSFIKVEQKENEIIVTKNKESANALWGTTRSIISNMIVWVTEGYKKTLEIQGVWYKFEIQWAKLILSVGFSHKVEMLVPSTLKVEADEKKKNVIHVSWIDKQEVWEFAAKIRSTKKPEPYKGKGIRYEWEYVRRKAGKTGK